MQYGRHGGCEVWLSVAAWLPRDPSLTSTSMELHASGQDYLHFCTSRYGLRNGVHLWVSFRIWIKGFAV